MVAEPYVNHIPTMTGGVGFESLRHFYAHQPSPCRTTLNGFVCRLSSTATALAG
jgi:hypothetical protein